MRFYKNIYVQDEIRKKKLKIMDRLMRGKLQPGIHVITLSGNSVNQLEIYDSKLLLQPFYKEVDLLVVGIAKGYDGALMLVEQIVGDVYNKTETADVRSYIMSKEQE